MANTAGVNIIGDVIQHVSAGQESVCELSAPGFAKENIDVNILSPSKLPTSCRLKEDDGLFHVSFIPHEVGTYSMDIYLSGQKIPECPLFYKVYDSSLIRVSDIRNGIVGQPSQFRVDASQAGEGQLEISINDGEVPNHVQVLGGGRCLVHFTPDVPKPHTIDIKFNGEPVPGCPFLCQMADTSKVSVALHHLELMPVNKKANFQIHVDTTDNAELAVSVTGPRKDIPVQVTGNVKDGFVAQFLPDEVGPYVIGVEYNNVPVGGTPFTGKAYDSSNVMVSPIPWGTIGKSLEFTVDASRAGEGNLEITISARGRNIPTQVHPQGAARFVVSFVPLEATDHVINITFNKDVVPGAPFMAKIHTDPNRILVSGQSLAATAVGKPSSFTLSNVTGSASDLDIVIDSPNGEAIPSQVVDKESGNFEVEFCPEVAGEHQIYLSFASEPIPGSPFACKVYNVEAIQVRACDKGIVGKPVTFLVETSRAGPGNLEVTVNNGQVPTSAQAQGNHTYAISFIPKESKPHIVELKFNGENVPGSPFKCAIVDAAKVNLSGDGLEKVPVNKQATFFIEGQFDMGDPEVKIMSPLKKVLSSSIRFIGEGHYAVDYTPSTVGDHQVEVKMGDIQVQGSPFVIKAYDVNKVMVSNISSGFVGKPVFFSIDASQAGAGNLEIIVSVNGKNVPNYVQSEGNAKFRVNFKPLEPLTHMLSVKFNNEFVPKSPFACEIQGNKVVSLHGSGVQLCSVGRPATFSIDPSGEGTGDTLSYEITVVSPSGQELPVSLTEGSGQVNVEYLPEEVGPHIIKIAQDGIPVEGSPFTCNIYDVGKILVSGLTSRCPLGRPCTFTVDASKAGEGTLELVVTTAKTSVRAEVQARSRGLYDVTFVPHETNAHFVNITFNDEHIEQSPFECQITEHEQTPSMDGESGNLTAVRGKVSAVEVSNETATNILGLWDAQGKETPFEKVSSKNNKSRIVFMPQVVGKYILETRNEPVSINVFDPSRVQVMKSGQAFVGEGSDFVVDTSSAGRGALSVNVKAAGQDIKHSIKDVGSGRFEVTFFPYLPIPHKIDVKFNGASVARNLLEIKVLDPYQGKTVTSSGMGLFAAKVNEDTSFVIDTLGHKSNDFDILVTGPPEGIPPFEAIPLRCYQQKDGKLLAEFRSTSVGPHKIEVLLNGQHIRGSPFECQSFDPKAILVQGLNEREQAYYSGQPISFKLDRRRAGLSDLEVVVTSPVGDDLPIEIKGLHHEPGVDLVEFKPEMAGKYRFSIQYGGVEVPDSPLTFNVKEAETRMDFRAFGQGLQRGQVNHPCTFEIEQFNDDPLPHVEIFHPAARIPIKNNVEKSGPSSMRITYIPDCVGIFPILVQHENRAPVEYKSNVCNPKKIQLVSGYDTKKGDFNPPMGQGQESFISLFINEAGTGKMEAELTLPSQSKMKVDVHQTNDRAEVRFVPHEVGQYSLLVKFNGFILPITPMRGTLSPIAVTPELSSPNVSGTAPVSGKVKLTGTGLVTAICHEDNFFIIDGSRAAQGTPEVKMVEAATKLPVPVRLRKMGSDVYEARYSPNSPGDFALNIKWADHLVKGCPLTVMASPGTSSEHPASKVFCSGEGLRGGTLGKDIRSFIDTRKAGPGELSLHCVGPKGKTAYCELNDHQDGTFTLNLKPQEAGRHQLAAKYGGHHVKGSPFTVRVSGSPDPDKVKVYGPGIEHGVLAMYQSRFICDTRGAGAGQLTVRIRGPKGAFRVEMQRESQKDRTILCKYEPTEPGDYRIEVKWSGENVPGSPFVVMIFDTQEELSRFLQSGYSPTGYSSEIYSGSSQQQYSGSQSYGMLPWTSGN